MLFKFVGFGAETALRNAQLQNDIVIKNLEETIALSSMIIESRLVAEMERYAAYPYKDIIALSIFIIAIYAK